MAKTDSTNARQMRAHRAGLYKSANGQTAWWRTQSDSNPSPPPNSLLEPF